MELSNEPPWLRESTLELVDMLVASHQASFGVPLVAGASLMANPRLLGQEVFAADQAVLAHDGAADPRLIYANRAALGLWRRPWEAMIGLPSRLTAEPAERERRASALADARRREALLGYGGIRVDSTGRRFRIEGAKLWTLRDGRARARGQAASFSSWWWL